MKNFIYTAFCIFLITNVNANEVLLQTQQDVDYYGQAGYSWFPGTVRINTYAGQDSSTMITDLSPLLVFDSIPGSLIIENTILTNLHGLENLKIGYEIDVYENAELVDASALSLTGKFTSLKFRYNPKLEVLPSTENFERLGSLIIENNARLKDVYLVFNNPHDGIQISHNPSLQTIQIKDNSLIPMKSRIENNDVLTSVFIYPKFDTVLYSDFLDNPLLQTVQGFGNVDYIGLVKIQNNPSLDTLCHIQYVLNRGGVGWLNLSGNGSYANSEADILATDCSDFNTSVSEVFNADLSISPNPAQNEVFVKGILQPTLYVIYDMSGKQITQGTVNRTGSIDLTAVKAGMYILKVGNQHQKLLVE